ncbi:MAG: metallophosphoesterase [Rariglobus sp.]
MKLKSLFLACAALIGASFAYADVTTYLVDFGPTNRTTASPDRRGRSWNNYVGTAATVATPLLNTAGATTGGVQFAITQPFTHTSGNGFGSELVYVYSAASDFAYVQRSSSITASPVVQLELSGLNTDGTTVYDVKFFTSSNRKLPEKYISNYTVKALDGDHVVELEAVLNDRNIARIEAVQPTVDGRLLVQVRVSAQSNSPTSSYGGLGVLELVARPVGSEPVPDEDVTQIAFNLGNTPNPPATVGPQNPLGLTAYVWETPDSYIGRAGAAEQLRRAGFHVMPLPLDRPVFVPGSDPENDVDLVFLGSFVSDSPDYVTYMAAYGSYLDDYIDRAGLLVQMTQNDNKELEPVFIPDTQNVNRTDSDFAKAFVLAPNHPLMANVPITPGVIPTLTYTLGGTSSHAPNTVWEAFDMFFGFEVILSGDERARFPALMEGAYGQGRFVFSAMALDKIIDISTGTEVAPVEMAAISTPFFANLYSYAAKVRDRTTQAITITPQPGDREVTDGAWSLVLLPDTQIYSQNYPGIFRAQTSWVRDNAKRYNIRYTFQLGDITNNNTALEWHNARDALRVLDGHMPYAFVSGNHDHGPGGNASTRDTLLNDYLPYSNYANMPTFGGAMEPGNMLNTYHLFNAGGVPWIVMCLEWAPRDEVVAWANTVMTQYPNRKGILVTHAYMNNTNLRYDYTDTANPQDYNPYRYTTPGTKNDGEQLWQKLVRKHDFVLTVNGHVLGSGTGYRVDNNDLGNPVHQMLSNYQMRTLGGEGYLRILQFQPDGRTVQVKTYSPIYDGFLLTPTQDFSFDLPLNPPDSNNNGVPDYFDAALDSNGNGINNREEYVTHNLDPYADGRTNFDTIHAGFTYTSIVDYVKANPTRFDLFTEEMLAHLHPETSLFRGENGKIVLQLKVLASEDLKNWSDSGAEPVEWEADLPAGKEFYRIQITK